MAASRAQILEAFSAIQAGELDQLARILDHDAELIGCTHLCNQSLLHASCAKSNVSIVQLLIDRRANVDAVDIFNDTPLHVSCRRGLLDISKLLIDHGADIHAANFKLDTPLHVACRLAHLDIIRLLVDHGARWHDNNVCIRRCSDAC
jgi:ankyrin repeat protein